MSFILGKMNYSIGTRDMKSMGKEIPGRWVRRIESMEEKESRKVCSELQMVWWCCIKSLREEVARV